jgi:site-specific recombinase XerD
MRDVPSLSCIKRFYFYLVEVGLRAEDPTEHLYVRTPRLIRQDVMVLLGEKA